MVKARKKMSINTIKAVIVEGYEANDAELFSEEINCFFKQFVKNELHLFGEYYDTIFEGFSIKHYFCPYNELRFNIIRNSKGKYHYLGLTDLLKVEGLLDSSYHSEVGVQQYQYNSGKLELMALNTSSIETLNKIIANDSLFKKAKGLYSETRNLIKEDLAHSFIFHNYKKRNVYMGRSLVSIFSLESPWISANQLLEKTKEAPLTKDDRHLLTRFGNIDYSGPDGNMKVLNLSDYGLMAFEVRHTDSTFWFRQYFVPKLQRYSMAGCDVTDWQKYRWVCN